MTISERGCGAARILARPRHEIDRIQGCRRRPQPWGDTPVWRSIPLVMSEMGQTQKSECATGRSARPPERTSSAGSVRSEKCQEPTWVVKGDGAMCSDWSCLLVW